MKHLSTMMGSGPVNRSEEEMMQLELVVIDRELARRAWRIAAAVLVPILVVAGGAMGCAAQTGDPQSGDSTPSATPREEPDFFCLNGLNCAPAPTVSANAFFSTIYFKAGPFNPGDSILLVAESGSTWTATTTATSEWTCYPGQTCASWSSYATGSFHDANWPCSEPTEQIWALDETTWTWIGPTSAQNICVQ
jgi:hypothetical protein